MIDVCKDDVLFGKGTPISDHRGNRRMRQIIDSRLRKYFDIPCNAKKQKSEFISQTIDEISSGGTTRFLTRENEYCPYREVTRKEVHKKIVKLFADRKKRMGKEGISHHDRGSHSTNCDPEAPTPQQAPQLDSSVAPSGAAATAKRHRHTVISSKKLVPAPKRRKKLL